MVRRLPGESVGQPLQGVFVCAWAHRRDVPLPLHLASRRSEKQAVNSFFDAAGPGALRWYYQVRLVCWDPSQQWLHEALHVAAPAPHGSDGNWCSPRAGARGEEQGWLLRAQGHTAAAVPQHTAGVCCCMAAVAGRMRTLRRVLRAACTHRALLWSAKRLVRWPGPACMTTADAAAACPERPPDGQVRLLCARQRQGRV